MSARRIPPAGDPFTSAVRRDPDQQAPHGCIDGFVFIGHMVIGDDGEEGEVFDVVLCRRCDDVFGDE